MTDRPNLILILTDHWRGDSLGCLGHPVAETPHLDSLAREGMVFTRGYTPSPSCTPARRCLMTGLTPNGTGMLGYQDGVPWTYPRSFAAEVTRAGYQTINIGKTHFFPTRNHLGFEQLIVPEDYHAWLEKQPEVKSGWLGHGVPANSWLGRPSHLPEDLLQETWFTTQALDFLDRRDPTRPFFLCLSFNGPHPPWTPPQVYFDLFMQREMPPPAVGAWAQLYERQAEYPLDVNAWCGQVAPHLQQRARAAYFAYLAYIDAQIGRFITSLRLRGLYNDSLILMTSDHGEMLGDHNLWRKTYAFEGSARVPFVVRPPRDFGGARNRRIQQVVGWEDIMPTFLEFAGAKVPAAVEGRSLRPLLRGNTKGWREYYHGEHAPCYVPTEACQFLTDGDWKYIWNPITGGELLFHLAEDPTELEDLAPDPAQAERLALWRGRLARKLKGRPEKLSDGKRLKTGQVPAWRAPR
ncbi:MAG: arylsulfatase [Planctomycetota bacterium]